MTNSSAILFYGFNLLKKNIEDHQNEEEFESMLENLGEYNNCTIGMSGNEEDNSFYVYTKEIHMHGINPLKIKDLDVMCTIFADCWYEYLNKFVQHFKLVHISKKDFGWHLCADYQR